MIATNGYSSLRRGMEKAIPKNDDLGLAVAFTRRDPSTIRTLGAPVTHVDTVAEWVDTVDVCISCGGSTTDLEKRGPAAVRLFNTADSFDTHSKILTYFAAVDEATRAARYVSLISADWNPGLFSMLRVLSDAVLPGGASMAFWGPGVSQGHSDAIRRIEGVAGARQYTLLVKSTVHVVKNGEEVELTARPMHTRTCCVATEEGADFECIKREIVKMPNHFADYDTTVTFISAKELAAEHSGLPHGGTVIHRDTTSESVHESIEFELALELNPEFTGSVFTATARTAARKATRGGSGTHIVFDTSPSGLPAKTSGESRAHWL